MYFQNISIKNITKYTYQLSIFILVCISGNFPSRTTTKIHTILLFYSLVCITIPLFTQNLDKNTYHFVILQFRMYSQHFTNQNSLSPTYQIVLFHFGRYLQPFYYQNSLSHTYQIAFLQFGMYVQHFSNQNFLSYTYQIAHF